MNDPIRHDPFAARSRDDPLFSDEYYEFLARVLGEEKAAWARLPREQREKELTQIHESMNTPDDLDPYPPELGGGRWNP